MNEITIAVIIVAAGDSRRMGGDVPKPYRLLKEKKVVEHSLALFLAHPAVTQMVLVVNPAHQRFYQPIAEQWPVMLVHGGATRAASVRHALEALADAPPDVVLVHDAARPFVSAALLDRVIEGLENAKAVVPAIAVSDTIKQQVDAEVTTLPRETLYAAQTPQGFDYPLLFAAHLAADTSSTITDDASLIEAMGEAVLLVEGDPANRKLTYPSDWQDSMQTETRSGQGFDVHRLIKDAARPLMLGGVEIASSLALEGHSDADVVLHALVDAMLGALGQGDIGEHFPPSEPRWKNADSAMFVEHAAVLMREAGARLINADITIIAEQPRITPHKTAMREKISQLLDVQMARINIKATTTEGLGFTGRGEGIAAQAIVTLEVAV